MSRLTPHPKGAGPRAGLWSGIALVKVAALAAAAGWIAYSRKVIDHSLPLPNAVNAPRRLMSSP
ncbi:MAG: hypothetical protein RMN25_11635, partial [Anaerolineae bacterium]|nr:hypothetical protein [Thermoflexales bacterium]MDW8408420.1 hypothetical protein [Anaerolineae bacterium]